MLIRYRRFNLYGAVGGSTALGNITIDTAGLTAAAIKLQGTLDITNSAASSITGVISNGASAASLTKAGAGTLTVSGTNTYTGATTISAGTLKVTTQMMLLEQQLDLLLLQVVLH